MQKVLLIFSLVLLAANVYAQDGLIINGEVDATVTWIPPDARTDGTALPADEIAGYAIFWGFESRIGRCTNRPASMTDTSCYPTAVNVPDGTATSQLVEFIITQDSTAFFTTVAIDTDGLWSNYSNEVSKMFDIEIDQPPESPVTLEIDVTVNCITNDPDITCEVIVN